MVVLVSARDVRRQVERSHSAVPVHPLGDTDGQQLGEEGARDRRDRADGNASRQGESRVAIRREVVDHYVGDLRQSEAAGMLRPHLRGVLE
jgi:hypothetical protein